MHVQSSCVSQILNHKQFPTDFALILCVAFIKYSRSLVTDSQLLFDSTFRNKFNVLRLILVHTLTQTLRYNPLTTTSQTFDTAYWTALTRFAPLTAFTDFSADDRPNFWLAFFRMV